MKIAVAQLNTRPGDFEKTASRMVELSQRAAEQNADLLVFPLATLTGHIIPDMPEQTSFATDTVATIEKLADEVACPCLIPVPGDLFDFTAHEVFLVGNGEAKILREPCDAISKYERRANYAMRYTDLAPNAAPLVFDFEDLHIGIAFSYQDMGDLSDADEELDVLIFISQYSYSLTSPDSLLGETVDDNRLTLFAQRFDSWFVGVGSVGGYGQQLFSGSSFVISPDGLPVALAAAFEDDLITADVYSRNVDFAPMFPQPNDKELASTGSPLHLWLGLQLSLHDFVEKQSLENVALQLDGRLNSSVLLVLASDALGPTHVYAQIAPGLEPAQQESARLLAKSLHVFVGEASVEIPSSANKSLLSDLLEVNLAAFAREHNALALGAQDKTFFALEAKRTCCYGASLLPLGDIFRSTVLNLGKTRNTMSPVIPPAVFSQFDVPYIEGVSEARPTPEKELEFLDRILRHCIEDPTGADVASVELTENVLRRMGETQLARMACPPCLIMSDCSVFDIRRPLGLAWQQHECDPADECKLLEITEYWDRESDDDETESQKDMIKDLFSGIGQASLSGALSEGVSPEDITRSVGDMLNLLQDMLQSGSLSISQTDDDKGQFSWGSLFSEN